MRLLGLGSREQGPPTTKADTHQLESGQSGPRFHWSEMQWGEGCRCGEAVSQVSGASTGWGGAWDILPGLGSRELGPTGRNPTFTSPLAVRAKASVVGDAIGMGL